MDFVKRRGFVDGILFTRSQLALPEFLSLDVESINHIRSEARCCVIASALALHACNISKFGTSSLSSSAMSDEINNARQILSSVLRRTYFEQNQLESNVIEAIGALTKGKYCSCILFAIFSLYFLSKFLNGAGVILLKMMQLWLRGISVRKNL